VKRALAALALAALACRGGEERPVGAPAGDVPSARDDAAASAVPGRLAFGAVAPGSAPSLPWSPTHPEAEVVAFAAEWPEPEGTRYLAVAPGWADTVRYAGVTNEPYGCDGTPTALAAFDATRPAPEGPVWLAPLESDVEAVALGEARAEGAASEARAWEAGPATLDLTRLGPSGARLTLTVDGAPAWSQAYEAYAMGEEAPPAVDFATTVPGIPRPIAAFRRAGEGLPVVVLWRPGYEGNAFDLLRADAHPIRLVEGEAVYACAY
jgi:hypothetical protein